MSAQSALKCLCFSSVCGLLSAPIAFSQIQPSDLKASLQDVAGVSTVQIGDKGVPAGYQGAYSVNTLIYPDGRVDYRVEGGIFRGPVGQMEESIPSGTTLKISSV